MISPIKLKRLKDAEVKGSFAIISDSVEDFLFLRLFFDTEKNYIWFKDIKKVDTKTRSLKEAEYSQKAAMDCKFYIKYESLIELLKLREVFNIRANKFDMYLIKKRGYDMFKPDFYSRCADMTIYKVKK